MCDSVGFGKSTGQLIGSEKQICEALDRALSLQLCLAADLSRSNAALLFWSGPFNLAALKKRTIIASLDRHDFNRGDDGLFLFRQIAIRPHDPRGLM